MTFLKTVVSLIVYKHVNSKTNHTKQSPSISLGLDHCYALYWDITAILLRNSKPDPCLVKLNEVASLAQNQERRGSHMSQ